MSCAVCSPPRRGPSLSRRGFTVLAALGPLCIHALANAAKGDPRLERLFQTFIAPCCWRENLLVHQSPLADELRASIRADVEQGKSDEEIKAALVRRYSTRILSLPEGVRGVWLQWTPWAMAAAGLAALAGFLHRAKKHPAMPVPAGPLPDLPDDDDLLSRRLS